MRTFQALRAQALDAAAQANRRQDADEARRQITLAAEWHALDTEAVRRAAARGHGPGAHHG